MERGNASRNVKKNQMNSQSSRSHSILQISLRQKDSSHRITKSKLILVDLAGSERSTRTGATGDKQKEGSAINVSLTTLGKVHSCLVLFNFSGNPRPDCPITRSSKPYPSVNLTCLSVNRSLPCSYLKVLTGIASYV